MIIWETLQAVFLDADDTLYRVRGSVGEHYAPHLRDHGVEASPDEIDAVVLKSWLALGSTYENWENDHVTDHARDREVWRGFVGNILSHFSPTPPSDELFEAIYQTFALAESRELTPRVTEFLLWARAQGLKTGIITNNDRRIHDLIPALGIADHFDYVFCASDIGYKKPSPHLFEGVRKHTGLNPEEHLYIGDSIELDFNGGTKAGWQAVHFAPGIGLGKPAVSPTIRCFGELLHQSPATELSSTKEKVPKDKV